MKKKKNRWRPSGMPAAIRKQEVASDTESSSGPTSESLIKSGRSLLNKYNQKRPAGTKKLSPAADEEME